MAICQEQKGTQQINVSSTQNAGQRTGHLTSFTLFPKLPPELRLMIYEAFIHQHRLIELNIPLDNSEEVPVCPQTPLSVLFHVCYESREVAERIYGIQKTNSGFQYIPPQILLNPRFDTILLSRDMFFDQLNKLGTTVCQRIRSLALPQDTWCDIVKDNVGFDVYGWNPKLIANLEEIVIIAVPQKRGSISANQRLPASIWPVRTRDSNAVSQQWDIKSNQYDAGKRWPNGRDTTLWQRSWSFLVEDVTARWKSQFERYGIKREIRVRRGVVAVEEDVEGAKVIFPEGKDVVDLKRDEEWYKSTVDRINKRLNAKFGTKYPQFFLPSRQMRNPGP